MPDRIRSRCTSLFALVVLACAALAGCGKGKGDISGKVSYKGTLLKGGNVTFVNEEGGPSFTAAINEVEGARSVDDLGFGVEDLVDALRTGCGPLTSAAAVTTSIRPSLLTSKVA